MGGQGSTRENRVKSWKHRKKLKQRKEPQKYAVVYTNHDWNKLDDKTKDELKTKFTVEVE